MDGAPYDISALPPALLEAMFAAPELAAIELDRELVKQGGLRAFAELAWHTVEADGSFRGGWHIDAICAHLEAVSRGEIRRLAIAVPPRSMKSLLVSAMWPAWDWLTRPDRRFLFSSYAQALAMRDSVKSRRIIQSAWYQARWGDVFQLTGDQNAKERYENTRHGYRIATSVGGRITGEGGDVVCFPSWELVATEHGLRPIGDLVAERAKVRVWSYDTKTGAVALKPITGWHANPGRPICRVTLSDGSFFECTGDHKVWTRQGWVAAELLDRQHVLPQVLDLRPSVSAPNVLDHRVANAHLPGDRLGGANINSDGLGLLQSDRRLPVARLTNSDPAVPSGVGHIVGLGAVDQVGWAVVERVSVDVSDQMADRRLADERECHELMDFHRDAPVPRPERDLFVAGRPDRRAQHAPLQVLDLSVGGGDRSRFAPDPPDTGCTVAREPRDRTPVLIECIGHVDATYCLTIQSYNTMLIGRGAVIVANCVDDPHNATEAESEQIREGTLRWWDEAMSTRLNNAQTGAYVVIQQRVHERDLLGHVLRKQGAEPYTYLCLPALYEPDHPNRWFRDPRKEAGEPLWPEHMPLEVINERRAALGEYAFAAQMQQRPAPREGGLFKRSWFSIIPAAPTDVARQVIRAWDLAATEEKATKSDPDYTASVKLGFSASLMKFVILDVVRTREDPAAVRALIRQMAEIDGKAVRQVIPQDPGQAGKDQAKQIALLLAGWPVIVELQTGEKWTRAQGLAAQAAVGNVVLVKADWNATFLDELTGFPTGSHDDMVDAASSAFNRISGGTTGILDWMRERMLELNTSDKQLEATVKERGLVGVHGQSTDQSLSAGQIAMMMNRGT